MENVSADLLDRLADRLVADLRTRFPDIVVRFEEDEDGLMVCRVQDGPRPWGEAGTSFDEDDYRSAEDAERLLEQFTFNLAYNLWPDELTDPWPLCHVHGDHPLNPGLAKGIAAWVCPRDSRVAIPVGSLGRT